MLCYYYYYYYVMLCYYTIEMNCIDTIDIFFMLITVW
jgi:hypothetical protein